MNSKDSKSQKFEIGWFGWVRDFPKHQVGNPYFVSKDHKWVAEVFWKKNFSPQPLVLSHFPGGFLLEDFKLLGARGHADQHNIDLGTSYGCCSNHPFTLEIQNKLRAIVETID